MSPLGLILIIDDNEDDYLIISRIVAPEYRTRYVRPTDDIQAAIRDNQPDCILLDYHMEPENGLEILQSIRTTEIGRETPVIMLTGEQNYRVVVECMKQGAADYIVKADYSKDRVLNIIAEAIEAQRLDRQNRRKQAENRRLLEIDELTGAWNRRYLLERLNAEIQRRDREDVKLIVAFVDLDNFKTINDTYGHLAGDTLLRTIARTIQNTIRDRDFLGRYGGDEFIIVFNELAESKNDLDLLQSACRRLDEIRRKILRSEISLPECDRSVTVSVSFGASDFNGQSQTASKLLDQADRALYYAKNNGRNRVAYFSQDRPILFTDDE